MLDANLAKGVADNTTIDGALYSIPFDWGTTGLAVDVTKAPDVKGFDDLCDPAYAGKTSMRLRRTILLGTAFAMGKDPFALYADPAAYQEMLNEVEAKLIECKANIKAFWEGGTDLEAMLISGEVVASEAWDQTAFKLTQAEPGHPLRAAGDRGADLDRHLHAAGQGRGRRRRLQVDQLRAARGHRADDVGLDRLDHRGRRAGSSCCRPSWRTVVTAAFTQADLDNLKYFANIPPGIEDMEGKTLDRIQAAQ